MRQPEGKFKSDLVKAFKKLFPEGWHIYILRSSADGTPDLFFAHPEYGRCWVEAKAGVNVCSSAQLLAHGRMSVAGEQVVVVTVDNPRSRDKHVLVHVPCSQDETEIKAANYDYMNTTSFWAGILHR